ncbi:MAG: voltage-gated potassium channel [Maribacter sp.]|jgi:voltage-gated potassium channel
MASFSMPESMENKLDVFTYFSFVTLTNLGYGDITPLTPPSQSMALFLAISGQLYLAIVVGILVGKFILFRSK